MLVEMVRLRRSGAKLKHDEVRAATPIRGELSVYVHRGAVLASMLVDNHHADEIPPLEAPRITRMKGSSFLLVGVERVHHRQETEHYPQAWWYRLPAEPEPIDLMVPTLSREEKRLARLERG